MAIYVDDAVWPFRGQKYCHMIADTPNELDDFARRIGLKPAWKQDAGKWGEHFDLSPMMRRRAVYNGAVEITGRELGRKLWARRLGEERDHANDE